MTTTPAPAPDRHDPAASPDEAAVLRLGDIDARTVATLLAGYDIKLELLPAGADIPGSYWGAPEAGLIGSAVYARPDTPVHSLLHEACHLIVLPPERRAAVHTDATDSIDEENAVCVLQALLGDQLPGVGRHRILDDMDRWGYSFRLGSARAYFEQDADDAFDWLRARDLLPASIDRTSIPCADAAA